MKIKTEGACLGCGEKRTATYAGIHVLKCAETLAALQRDAKLEEGYLIRVSWDEQPHMYWLLIAMAKSLTFDDLDAFLRKIWLECCGHLSEFIIGGKHNFSDAESDELMEKQVGQMFYQGMEFRHAYDFGSTTKLILKVLKPIEACSANKVVLLMRNDPPEFSCERCQKQAHFICSICNGKICRACWKRHSCVKREDDLYMLAKLVNSPRTGVCGYE